MQMLSKDNRRPPQLRDVAAAGPDQQLPATLIMGCCLTQETKRV